MTFIKSIFKAIVPLSFLGTTEATQASKHPAVSPETAAPVSPVAYGAPRVVAPARHQYQTSFAVIPSDFPNYDRPMGDELVKIAPRVPKGDDWRMVGSNFTLNNRGETVILFFWERPWEPSPKLGY